jgi:hypothetical protein
MLVPPILLLLPSFRPVLLFIPFWDFQKIKKAIKISGIGCLFRILVERKGQRHKDW